jgi:hypothetical protein
MAFSYKNPPNIITAVYILIIEEIVPVPGDVYHTSQNIYIFKKAFMRKYCEVCYV